MTTARAGAACGYRKLVVVVRFVDDNVARAQVHTMKPVVIVAGVGPGIGTSVARAFGAEGFGIAPFIVDLEDAGATRNAVEHVRTWAGGDPSIAAALVRLHRGTNEVSRSTLQMALMVKLTT